MLVYGLIQVVGVTDCRIIDTDAYKPECRDGKTRQYVLSIGIIINGLEQATTFVTTHFPRIYAAGLRK